MEKFLEYIEGLVWGVPLVVLLVFAGLYFTFVLRGIQFTRLLFAFKELFSKTREKSPGTISHFKAYMLASAATIGRVNIIGVAFAMAIGGAGALFWMWVLAFIGMATKYAEATLGVKYRVQLEGDTFVGGPMYYIERGIGWKWLASFFAATGLIGAIGIGNMLQVDSFVDVLSHYTDMSRVLTGVLIALVTIFVVVGGLKVIASVTAIIVPTMIVGYIVFGAVVLIFNYELVPAAFLHIFKNAFVPKAALGGFLGSIVAIAFKGGGAKSLFSSETGQGTAGIAAATAKTDHPSRQALIAMTDVFVDTIILSTITGLIMIVTGTLDWYRLDPSIDQITLPFRAFNSVFPVFGGIVSIVILLLFIYSTILGWYFYGKRCFYYLFGVGAIRLYQVMFAIAILVGAVVHSPMVRTISYIASGLMAIINLIAILVLSDDVKKETKDFIQKHKDTKKRAPKVRN